MRPGHGLDSNALLEYMRDTLGIKAETLAVREFGHGQVYLFMYYLCFFQEELVPDCVCCDKPLFFMGNICFPYGWCFLLLVQPYVSLAHGYWRSICIAKEATRQIVKGM